METDKAKRNTNQPANTNDRSLTQIREGFLGWGDGGDPPPKNPHPINLNIRYAEHYLPVSKMKLPLISPPPPFILAIRLPCYTRSPRINRQEMIFPRRFQQKLLSEPNVPRPEVQPPAETPALSRGNSPAAAASRSRAPARRCSTPGDSKIHPRGGGCPAAAAGRGRRAAGEGGEGKAAASARRLAAGSGPATPQHGGAPSPTRGRPVSRTTAVGGRRATP